MHLKQQAVGEQNMENGVLYELGVDINSSFTFNDGDLNLCKYEDNLIQAIQNRLQTDLNELDLFYEDYGSILPTFLGWKGNDETINFVKSELETVLQSEKRLISWEYEVEYKKLGVLEIKLILHPNTEYSITTVFEVNENGVEVSG